MLHTIREAEKASHIETYSKSKLFESGSWLQKPVKTVLDLFSFFNDFEKLNVLDLGCGVGRNCIPIAQKFKNCTVDCVDILEFAIEKLSEYADKYGVSNNINGIVSSIDDYKIEKSKYDLILAISALEHIKDEKAFKEKLLEIKNGVRENGIICFIINSEIVEKNKNSGQVLVPQFEVNLKTKDMLDILNITFKDWEIIKSTIREQRYDIPRNGCIADLSTNVVTVVARKIVL